MMLIYQLFYQSPSLIIKKRLFFFFFAFSKILFLFYDKRLHNPTGCDPKTEIFKKMHFYFIKKTVFKKCTWYELEFNGFFFSFISHKFPMENFKWQASGWTFFNTTVTLAYPYFVPPFLSLHWTTFLNDSFLLRSTNYEKCCQRFI